MLQIQASLDHIIVIPRGERKKYGEILIEEINSVGFFARIFSHGVLRKRVFKSSVFCRFPLEPTWTPIDVCRRRTKR